MLAELKLFHLLFSLAEIQRFILIWLSQSFRSPTSLELFFFFLALVFSAVLTTTHPRTCRHTRRNFSNQIVVCQPTYFETWAVEDMDPLKYSSNHTIQWFLFGELKRYFLRCLNWGFLWLIMESILPDIYHLSKTSEKSAFFSDENIKEDYHLSS